MKDPSYRIAFMAILVRELRQRMLFLNRRRGCLLRTKFIRRDFFYHRRTTDNLLKDLPLYDLHFVMFDLEELDPEAPRAKVVSVILIA